MAPTLPTACGSLPPEGAVAPAARQSRFRGPGWVGDNSRLAAAWGSFSEGVVAPAALARMKYHRSVQKTFF